MVSTWVWHIIAGAIGTVISLSAFYQMFEKKFAVHKKISAEEVKRIVGQAGKELEGHARLEFLAFFNRLVYIGRLERTPGDYRADTVVQLKSGEQIQLAKADRFYEVRRVRTSGKMTCYRLFDRP